MIFEKTVRNYLFLQIVIYYLCIYYLEISAIYINHILNVYI